MADASNSGLPPLPDGFSLDTPAAAPAMPALPAGFTLDAAPAPAPAPAAAPTLQRPRSLGQAAGDTALALGQGALSVGSLLQLPNMLSGGALDREVWKPITGAVDRLAGGTGEGRTMAQSFGDTRQSLEGMKSEQQQQLDQELSDTKGFVPTLKKVITTPALAVDQLAQQVPQLIVPGGIVRKVGTAAFERAAGEALAKGIAKRVAGGMTEDAARAAATKTAERIGRGAAVSAGATAARGTEAVMSGTQNSEQAQQEVLGMDQKVLDADPQYQALLKQGYTPQDAREARAMKAGQIAGALAAALTYGTGGLTAKLESRIFQGETGVHGLGQLASIRGLKETAKAVGKETAQEGLQEGAEQLAQNVGVRTVDPNKSLLDQVPENAAIGSLIGGGLGGGTFVGSAALSRPNARPVPNPGAAPGSLSDAANVLQRPATGPVGRAAQEAVRSGATAAAQAAQAASPTENAAAPAPAPAQAAPAAQAATPGPMPEPGPAPWADPTTGEVTAPSKGQLTKALSDYILDTYLQAGHMRVNAQAVADAWGVPKADVNRVRQAATKSATDRVAAAEREAMNPAPAPSFDSIAADINRTHDAAAARLDQAIAPTENTSANDERLPEPAPAAPAGAGAEVAGATDAQPAAIGNGTGGVASQESASGGTPDVAAAGATTDTNGALTAPAQDQNAAPATATEPEPKAARATKAASGSVGQAATGSSPAQAVARIETVGSKGIRLHGDPAAIRAQLEAGGFKKKGTPQKGALRFDAADRPRIEAALAAAPSQQPVKAVAPGSTEEQQQIQQGFADNKAAIARHKFKAGDTVTFTSNGKAITGTIAKGDKAGMAKDMGIFEVEHPGRNGMARATVAARFLSPAAPAAPATPTGSEKVAPAAKPTAFNPSPAARKAESLRVKASDGEVNGRTHVDQLVQRGFTRLTSTPTGNKLTHALVNASGESQPIHARQLAYAQEVVAKTAAPAAAAPPSSAMTDARFTEHLPAFVAQYRELAAKAGNADYFNADLAKELFPEYNASNEARRDNNEKVSSRASKIAFTAFQQRLQQPVQAGDEGVTLMAGGTGSGKSALKPASGIVYDSTMYDAEAARRNVAMVLESGRAVDYRYVFTEPESAFSAAIARGKEHGRYVNLTAFVRTHEGAYQAVKSLMREYADDPRVDFELYNNTGFARDAIEELPAYDYHGLRERLQAILDAEYRAGRVSEAEYQAIAKAAPPAGGVAQGQGKGSRPTENGRPEQSEGLVTPETPPTGGVSASLASKVEAAASEAAAHPDNGKPEPTQAQKEAGNYEKGHVFVQGLDISIENPRGSTRSGVGENGKPWSHVMTDHYGYIRRTEGADGEQVDVYVGPNPDSKLVVNIDQLDQKTGKFDEHKVMLGFDSQTAAVNAYRTNFDPGWKVGPVTSMSMDEFKAWLKNGDTSNPVAAIEATPTEKSTPAAAAPVKWFGTQAKADAYIAQKGMGDTHEVVQEGKRFDIRPKNDAAPAQAAAADTFDTSRFAGNKIFTADKVAAAHARLKAKLGTLNSGIDPEVLVDGMTIAGAYIEGGLRKFTAYAGEMVNAFGDGIKPYLLAFYEAVRHYPGVDTQGMDSLEVATRAHEAMITPADTESEAIGNAKPPVKKRVKSTPAGDVRLKDDFGVDSIDGYGGADRETGNDTKDAFLKDAKAYLKAVSSLLDERGFTVTLDGKGKPGRAVYANEGGPAGSGDVTMHMVSPSGTGIYVTVGGTALRGMVPSTSSGIALMYRTTDGTLRRSGVNQWGRVDLTAAELAAELAAHAERHPLSPVETAAKPAHNPATTEARTDANPADHQPTDAAGPEVGRVDSTGGDGAGSQRGRAAQPGAARADSGVVEAGKPEDVGAAASGGFELSAPAGPGDARADVAAAANADGRRDVGNGRPRAGGARNADDGAGEPARPGRAGRGRGRDAAKVAAALTDPAVVKPPAEVSPSNAGPGNFHYANPLEVVGGGQVARFNKNRAAIELLNTLRDESRQATAEEQLVLAGYTGWGSFGQELFQGTWDRPRPASGWEARDTWLRENVDQAEWESLQRSITNAHYTDPPTVLAMWSMIQRMGFTGGRVLEPAMGIGNFFGMMPPALAQRSQLTGIELDTTTGSMAQKLYPAANVQVMGYQESRTPDGFYDVIVGNWPFENTPIADRRYQRLNPMVHDYFFLKTMDQVRPGGLVVAISSAGTMDKKSISIRAELARKGELVAAFRLPSGAFQEYAGTKVVTDILVLRKRAEPIANPMAEGWIESKEHPTPNGTPVFINEYYHAHPDHVVGTIDFGHGTTSGREGMIVHRPDDMAEQLQRIAAMVPEGAYKTSTRADTISYVTNHTSDREGSLVHEGGKLMVVRGERLAPADQLLSYTVKDKAKTAARVDQLQRLVDMRKQYAALIDAERHDEAGATKARKALKAAYDAFTAEHGLLNASYGLDYLRRIDDPFYPALAALEIATGGRGKAAQYRPAQILTQSTTRAKAAVANPSITDAFVIARNRSVNPSLDEIATIAGKAREQVRDELVSKGSIFELPSGDIVPSDIYLSGNVREKLRQAREAVEVQGNTALQRNIDALQKVVPADIPYYKIETQFGATWVSTENYQKYIAHMLGTDSTDGIGVSYTAGRWRVQLNDRLKNRPEARANFGTQHVGFRALLQAAISNQTITIHYPKTRDGGGGVNEDATKEVNEKISNIRSNFGEWLWGDAERQVAAEREYNEVRNAYATPHFDGSFLGFEGMALTLGRGKFDLREHQVNAIWRALVTRKSLNAHEVGTGKTFTMGGIAVESRRYGIAKKPLLLAHNANSKSVASEIQQMYPSAKVLYIDNLSPATIAVKMRQIANDDWDAIVVPHSLIDRLSFKEETLMAIAKEEITELEQAAYDAATDDHVKLTPEMLEDEEALKKLRSPTAKNLVKMRNRIINAIKKQAIQSSREDAVPFEDLGIDMLLVDEAHEFKKPPFSTTMKMKGLQTAASSKSIALNFMAKYIRTNNAGGNVHLFTGTPVTNTLTEVFHMMRYVMQEEMQQAGVDQWDGWFGSFAREVQDVELNAAGEYESVTRLAAFINVPELRRMIGQYMDVVFSDDMPEMQPRRTASGKTMADADLTAAEREELLSGRTENAADRPYKKVVIETADLTPAQAAAFEQIQQYAKEWRNMGAKARKEAMLAGAPQSPIIYEGLANKSSLDARLLHGEQIAGREGNVADDEGSKASRVVKNVVELYHSHPLANQVIFSDLGLGTTATRSVGVPGKKTKQNYRVFSTLRDVIERLVQAGIPREQIAMVDGSTSKDKRKEVADKMNTGEIRVVIGSSDSLGVGVNMQRNLRAMHHMDAPWMPGDLEQRNGRGQRQGNQWNTVLEYRYLTDRLDGRRWQVLAIKDRFIKAFLKSNDSDRVIEGDAASDEQSDILQTFAEAAGDPRILIREKLKKKIDALQSKERLHGRAMADNKSTINRLTSSIDTASKRLSQIQADRAVERATAAIAANAGKNFSMKIDGKTYTDRESANEAIIAYAEKNLIPGGEARTIGTYGAEKVLARKGSFGGNPLLSTRLGDTTVAANNPGISSFEATLRSFPTTVERTEANIAEDSAAVTRMKATLGEPFHLGDQLASRQKELADLERDIAVNPVPPPAWLRAGAPIDTETTWKGKRYLVTGHRWTDSGWYVMGDAGDGSAPVQIPYLEAKDDQGIPQYEERPFQPPKVLTEAERKAQDAAGAAPATGTAQFRRDASGAGAATTASQAAHTARIQAISDDLRAHWQGDDVPRVQVVATPEHLPAMAKVNPVTGEPDNSYQTASGMYDGRTVWLVASKHTDNAAGRAAIATTLAHEVVGHYGVDRIIHRELGEEAWRTVENNFDRLRKNRALGSPAMRGVLDDVERRYRQQGGAPADPATFAREALAVMAERGVKNGLLDRAITALRKFIRRFFPSLRLGERELRQLLVQSKEFIERGQTQQQRVQGRAALAFSSAAPAAPSTPAFREFFGDSKVVDADGNPLPVYHGTAEEFDTFDPARSGSTTAHMTANLGTFFAESRAKAQHYAENASQGVPAEERVIDAYLAIRNPYTLSLKRFMGLDSQEESAALRQKLIAEGYDGIHIPEVQQWIAFQPNQIKSASENRGTFDTSTGNIYFSRDDADPDNPAPARRPFGDASASIESMHAELPQLDRTTLQKAKDWIAGKARDFEPVALGALQLRHVLELAADDPTLKQPAKSYGDLYQRMDGDRNQMTQDGAEKVDALQKWARAPGPAGWLKGKIRPEAAALFKFMHAVTQLAVDPTNAYERLLMRDAGNEYKPWTKDLIKERIRVLRKTALTRSGDDKTRIYDEIKELERLPQRERVRQERYPKLVAQWNALSPEAKHHFEVMRDHYQEQSAALEAATIKQLEGLDIPDQAKRQALLSVRDNFRAAKVDGVYFPLSRFGDYWLSLRRKDGEYVFAKYETANEMQQAEKRWLADGAEIEARGRQDNNYRAKDAPSGTFIGDLMGILKNAPDKTKDEIYQMYLKTLPALSLRKHGIHRSNVAGYTDDVPRAFANSVFHGAHQISKARYGWQLQATMEQMRERMEARRTVITGTQAAHGDALLGELNRRHDWIMNPTNNQLANHLTSIGFSYFLAASPASALVNLIQVPQIVLPVLSAQHGWGRTTRVLTATMRDAIRTRGRIDKVLTGEDLLAFKALQEHGTFQRSATHALAGISEGDQLRSSQAYAKVMNVLSWMFHTSEVINREGTGMAAFRLAREKGQSFEEAVKYADEMTNGTHGDYSNANRARYMQGNVMKVLTQFKNYSLAMSWLWGRQIHQAFKGESPEVRAVARKTLTGMLGMTGLFAGVVGMPIFNLLRYGAMAAHAVGGDPDEPWDFMTEFRAWLAEHLGETAANLIADGAASELGANVASRVSMSDLWFRDADRQLEGEDAYNAMLQAIAGPLGGMIKNMYVGAQQFNEGHTARGIETMLPSFAKNAVKAVRYASQGVNTLRGDPIVADISAPQALIQAIGFQPTTVARQMRTNNSLYTYQQAILERRQALMNGFAMAVNAGDVDGQREAMQRIQKFNRTNPEVVIGVKNLRASLRQRARFSAEASNGIRLNKKLATRLREEVGAAAAP